MAKQTPDQTKSVTDYYTKIAPTLTPSPISNPNITPIQILTLNLTLTLFLTLILFLTQCLVMR